MELCQLIGYQIDKEARSFEILNENDIVATLIDIRKNMNENFEKLSKNSRDQFLCFKKLEINIFKYNALKKHTGSYIELPKSLQRQGLIDIKNTDNYCFIWSYIRQIYKVHDPPLSNNDRCSMFHDIAYTIAENVGKNAKDVKNKKLQADDKWLDCFKVRTPYDMLAYSAIKTKKTLGLGNNFTMEDLSNELNKPTIQKFERQKVIVNHINEIHSTDLVDMTQYPKINKGYKYIFTNIDVFSKIAYAFPFKSKKVQDIKPCFQKIFMKNKPKFIWSDKESSFFSKEMQ